jgi:hypothetical protein
MISGGFWGLGGGWLIVPALLLAGVDFQTAVAASLLQMAPSAFVTVVGQVRKIGWSKGSWGMKVALPLCAATFIGSFFGSPLGHFLEWLFGGTRKPHEILYIGLLVWIIWETLTRRNKNQSPYSEPPPDLKMAGPCAAGFGIGAIAAMLGVGGGIQTRPLLANVLQVPEGITAMITRLAIFLTATAGSISYLCDASVKKGAVVSMALCLMAGGIVGFRVGAWMHSVVLKAGGAAKAGGSFALVAFAVLLGMVCKTTGLIMAGRCLILLAGISLTAYLVFETVKAKRVVKELGSEEGNAT